MQSSPTSEDLFAACNHTELLQICARLGLKVSPATPSSRLINYLLGNEEVPEGSTNNIDAWRQALMDFLADHWQVLRAQISCPAKNLKNEELQPGEKRACFNCVDVQVISCLVQNPANEELIQLKRK